MITDALLALLHTILSWLNGIRPAWVVHLPSAVSSLISFAKGFDNILPVTEILVCLGFVVTLFTATTVFKWSVKVVDWIADVIP